MPTTSLTSKPWGRCKEKARFLWRPCTLTCTHSARTHARTRAHTRTRAPPLHTVRRRVQREGVRRELQACKTFVHACLHQRMHSMRVHASYMATLAQTSMLVGAQQQTARESAGSRTREKTRMPRVTRWQTIGMTQMMLGPAFRDCVVTSNHVDHSCLCSTLLATQPVRGSPLYLHQKFLNCLQRKKRRNHVLHFMAGGPLQYFPGSPTCSR